MEFDKTRCYSALNADELKHGDKVVVADNLVDLMEFVRKNDVHEIEDILSEKCSERFGVCGMANYALAYLVERAENCTNCGARWVCPMGVPKEPKLTRCDAYEPIQKKENKWRPFKDTDELIKVWGSRCNEGKGYILNSLDMPHIWIRQKECSKGGLLITYFGEDEVKTDMGFMTMSKLLSDYTFTDGSPCGVEE